MFKQNKRKELRGAPLLHMNIQTLVDLNPAILIAEGAISDTKSVTSTSQKSMKLAMAWKLIKENLGSFGLICFGYLACYYHLSLILLPILAGSVLLLVLNQRHLTVSASIKAKAKACTSTRQELEQILDEIPAWVKFPDKERATWLNEVIAQVWPSLNSYLIRTIRGSLQTQIKQKYESFNFEHVNFGREPLKIDGIKVYPATSEYAKAITMDFDIHYDGNCDITCSLSGASFAGIKNFQMSASMRVVFKPLLMQMPILGGVQVYFLNTPQLAFSLDGLTNFPGLSHFIRQQVVDRLQKMYVFPNKYSSRFTKKVESIELKRMEPSGVLRVHLIEGQDLVAKDYSGKSDPYAIMSIGAQNFRSPIIKKSLNPQWDYWCEFVVGDPLAQRFTLDVYDKDNVNEDDFMGKGVVEIRTIIKGKTDVWLKLTDTKKGSVRVRFTWLTLTADVNLLHAAMEETRLLKVDNLSVGILTVYVDSIQNIPEAQKGYLPNPYFLISVYKSQFQKSKLKRGTLSPVWEQVFIFLLADPTTDNLQIDVIDKKHEQKLINFNYNISDLLRQNNLEVNKAEVTEDGCKLVLSLQLRILVKESAKEQKAEYYDDDSMSNSDSDAESLATVGHGEQIPEPVNVTPQNAEPPPTSTLKDYNLGKIEISMNYSEARQKFEIIIHQIEDLPQSYPDIPDPYVKIRLEPYGNVTYRTKKIVDCCNPVYNEAFEYLLSLADLEETTLEISVKTSKLFSNKTMGQLNIAMRDVNLREPTNHKWYPLSPK